MRILACADLHGKPERIARVRALVAEHAPDVLLLPGDLTHLDQGVAALDLLRTLPIPILAVPGNMDGAHAIEAIQRHGGLVGPKPAWIAGVSFGGPATAEPCDILVTHEPPYGTLDRVWAGRHAGSREILALVTRLRPRALACGHIHESAGVERLGDTLVVNCTMGDDKTAGALIEMTDAGVQARLLRVG
jgi:Icc-related predicted phosphoesterase